MSVTLGNWTMEWLDVYKKHEVGATSFKNYKYSVSKHILNSEIANLPLNNLKPIDIQRVINSVVQQGTMREAKFVYQIFNQIFNKAVNNELISRNLLIGIKSPRYYARKKCPLSKNEQSKFLKSAYQTNEEKLFVYLGLYTGMRKGEILALTKNDIDLENKVIDVNKNIIFQTNKGTVKNTPKSKAGNRLIPIPEELVEILKTFLSEKSNFLFTNNNFNEPVLKSQIRDIWESILDTVKLERHITIHYLRHTYATNLYYAGVDIKTAQYLLGHENSKMTIDLYTHLDRKGQLMTVSDKLSRYMQNIV